MSRDELADRIDALETANRRFRALAVLLGLALVVLVGTGWVGPGPAPTGDEANATETSRELRARSVVLTDDTGRPEVRLETREGALRISMLRSGAPAGAERLSAPGDSVREASGPGSASVRSSLVLYPSPGLVLYGPRGHRVVRLGEVEAVELR